MAELGALLKELDSVAPGGQSLPLTPEESTDDQLAKRRLGIAASLFAALQCKHAATASHSIRVALTCSAWATRLDFDERQREQLEIAALLHDIGIVGTPDHVLLKPTRLDSDEAAIMTRARAMSLEILRRSCTSTEILGIVENISAWYDGSRGSPTTGDRDGANAARAASRFPWRADDRRGRGLRRHDHRPRLPRCLVAGAGDGRVVPLCGIAIRSDPGAAVRGDARRRPGTTPQTGGRAMAALARSADGQCLLGLHCRSRPPAAGSQGEASLFEAKLLDNMYDAAVFVNSQGRIVQWNHGAERLTGIAGASIRQQRWHPDILKLSDEKNHAISEADCPVLAAISSGVQSLAAADGLGAQRPLRGRR